MNQDTIENHIKSLGKNDFDAVLSVVLAKAFGLTAVDVDGPGDGGSDFRLFNDTGGSRTCAVQKTVQQAQWQEKALDDATKAQVSLGAKRFFFLTSRAHESTALRGVENEITSKLGIPATCLGATEISGLIIEHKLLGDFAHAIGLQLDVRLQHRPDLREIMLHSYFALSHDRNSLRESVYDATLQSVLHFALAPLSRDELIQNAIDQLGCQESRRAQISGRVDSLLSRGAIVRDKSTSSLQLSDRVRESFEVSDGIYQKELEKLASAQTKLVSEYGGEWSQEQAMRAAVLLAQRFVQLQFKNARNSSLALTMTGFGQYDKDPEQDLRELILESTVVAKGKVDEIFSRFVELASDKPLIKKLTRSIIHIALESADPNKAAAVVGASRWSDVRVILDTSVAIPHLSASHFAPTIGRFSLGSNECIKTMSELSATFWIPLVYLNECANHLLMAMRYCHDLQKLEDSLEHSHNGFVSHYYQMKRLGKTCPKTLRDYVKALSPSAAEAARFDSSAAASVRSQLQPLFKSYGVDFEPIADIPEHHTRDIEISFTHIIERRSKKKAAHLVEHDVEVLGHIKRCISERSDKLMCLTWDGAMIQLGADLTDCGWVISPHEACDIIQPQLRLSQGRMTSLAHSVARTMAKPAELGARIVDRIVQLSGDHLDNWEFQGRIQIFRDEAINRIDLTSPRYRDELESDIVKFLQDEGIEVPDNRGGGDDVIPT